MANVAASLSKRLLDGSDKHKSSLTLTPCVCVTADRQHLLYTCVMSCQFTQTPCLDTQRGLGWLMVCWISQQWHMVVREV